MLLFVFLVDTQAKCGRPLFFTACLKIDTNGPDGFFNRQINCARVKRSFCEKMRGTVKKAMKDDAPSKVAPYSLRCF